MMLNHLRTFTFAAALSLAMLAPAPAQEPAAASEDELRIDDPIIVIGENGYPPLWRASRDDNEMYIFGLIDEVPRNTQWRTDQIEPIIQRANIILPDEPELDINIGIISAVRSLVTVQNTLDDIEKNANGQDLKTILDPVDYGRLTTIMGLTKVKPKEIEKLRPSYAAIAVSRALREAILEKTVDPSTTVRKLYDKHKKQVLTVEFKIAKMDFLAAIRELRANPPIPAARHVELACFRAHLNRMETDASSWGTFPQAWVNGDVDSLRANIDARSRLIDASCRDINIVGDLAVGDLVGRARRQLKDTLFWAAAKHKTGFVAMGVDRVLEKDGILDQFRDRGYQVEFVTPPEKSS